jgi:hypothetical protein
MRQASEVINVFPLRFEWIRPSRVPGARPDRSKLADLARFVTNSLGVWGPGCNRRNIANS